MLLKRFSVKSSPAVALVSALLLLSGDAIMLAQDGPPPQYQGQYPGQPQAQLLAPEQLDSLAAPVALYPDPLLSQILVAATYPLELVQASQWLQQNRGLSGPALTQAAAEQNWDPSVQALVVFPDLIMRLTQDITWTTNLGNAFLAQQGDVMDAVQRLRIRAEQAGKLASTPQQRVIDANYDGRPIIEIQPASPEIIYVPEYDPAYIWGPPVYYRYPRWYYPRPGVALVGGGFFGFGGGISMGLYFGGGWGGWGGWGWNPGWRDRSVIVNNTFIHRNNFNVTHITNVHGVNEWSHDSFHRQGVPYPNRSVAQQYGGGVRGNLAPRSGFQNNAVQQGGFRNGGFQNNSTQQGGFRNSPPPAGGFQNNSTQPGRFRNSPPAGGVQNNPAPQGGFRNSPPAGGVQNNPTPQGGFRNSQPPAGGAQNNPAPQGGFRNSPPAGGVQNNPTPQGGFRNSQGPAGGGFRNSPSPTPPSISPAPAPSSGERFGNRQIPPSNPSGGRSAFGGQEHGAAATVHSDHGYSSLGPTRSAPPSGGGGERSGGGNQGGGFGRRR